jgi:lipid-A-disaccharide synthase
MELAILQVPMVVSYRVSNISYQLSRHFIKVEFASLVNLIAEKEVVPELLQHDATPQNIYHKILPLLQNQESKDAMRRELAHVVKQLGEPGGSKRVAALAMEMLGG